RDGLDLADVGGANEEPLVGARPGEQDPPAARRPGDVAEPPEAAEHDPLAPQGVGVHDQQLAAGPEAPCYRDAVAIRSERRLHRPARELERLQTTTVRVEDDEREGAGGRWGRSGAGGA